MQRQWYTGLPDIEFCRMFYTELSKHGLVDRALQRARQRLYENKPQKWTWSTPVLYQHLGKGRLFEPEKRRTSGKKSTVKVTTRPGLYHGMVGAPIKPRGSRRGWSSTPKGHGPLEYAGLPTDFDWANNLPVCGGGEEEPEEEKAAPATPYKKAVWEQEQESFSKSKQRRALQELLDYYMQQRAALNHRLEQPGADRQRLQEEIADIESGIQGLQKELKTSP